MPRPVRSRVGARAATVATGGRAEPASDAPPAPKPVPNIRGGGGIGEPRSDSTDLYGVSDRELKKIAAEKATTATRSRAESPLRERGRRQPSAGRTRRRTAPDASGLDVMDDDDDVFGDLDLDASMDSSLDGDSELVTGQRSTDTSSFNVALFKRGRSRQSSIVGRDDAPIRPSSRGPTTPGLSSTFNLGAFKRRAREPSILGTGRKRLIEDTQPEPESSPEPSPEPSPQASSDDEGQEAGVVAQDNPDSEPDAPDAESTPSALNRRRTRASAASVAPEPLPNQPTSANSRKRKSTDGQEGSSKRTALPSSDDVRASIEGHDDDDDEQSLPQLPPLVPSTPPRWQQRSSSTRLIIDENDEILAPPASSGSSDGGTPTIWPSLKDLARKPRGRRAASAARKTPAAYGDDDASDMSSPPSLTHSPNYPAPRARGKAHAQARDSSPKLTTAQLTSMLPQRRRRVREDQWDSEGETIQHPSVLVESESDSDDDADELAHRGSRTTAVGRTRRQATATARPLAAKSNTATSKRPASRRGGKNKRTYGSRSFSNNSDKENRGGGEDGDGDGDTITVADQTGADDGSEALPDDTFESTNVELDVEELRQAAKKFKEVDKWELEFEEVTEPSSPGVPA